MALTNMRKSKQLVFVNDEIIPLLQEIIDYFKSHPMEEAQKYLDDMTVTYGIANKYIATVYLVRGEWNSDMP